MKIEDKAEIFSRKYDTLRFIRKCAYIAGAVDVLNELNMMLTSNPNANSEHILRYLEKELYK